MGVAQQPTQHRIRTLAEDEDSHPVSAIGLGARDVHDQSLGAAHVQTHENMRDRQGGPSVLPVSFDSWGSAGGSDIVMLSSVPTMLPLWGATSGCVARVGCMLRARMFGRHRDSSHGIDSAAIVRRLVRTDARVIGLLPGVDRAAAVLSVLLTEWAATMADFVAGPIGVVADWSTWNGSAGGAAVADEERPRLFSLVPPPCPDAATATPALMEAVSKHRGAFSRILVNLSRYAAPGHVPTAVEFVDGVAIIVPTGRMRRGRLKNLVQDLDARKNLGAILI